MYYITGISLGAPGTHVQHIEAVWWLNGESGQSNQALVSAMVDFIRQGYPVQVGGPAGPVAVEVVNANPPYLRTVADDTTRDNLLALPRF